MSEPKFTPGPWHVTKGNQSFYFVFGKDGCVIADFQHCTTSEEEQEFNAHLIKAAPEMYKELQFVCKICDTHICKLCGVGKVLRKARGESEIEK
jgi:hypothetical protein